jgi:PAS domain S-box-containing protein
LAANPSIVVNQVVMDTRMTSISLNDADVNGELLSFLKRGGETGQLLREIDWSGHPLGQPADWPNALQTTVGIILRSRQPMFVCWGPGHHTIYNDAYAQICGNKHPAGLGARFQDIWSEIWESLEPLVAQVYTGESIHMDDIQLIMHRKGYPEETHFSFSYNPLDDSEGIVAGFLCACAETTQQVLLKRELDHQRNQLGQIFGESSSFIAKLTGPDHVFEIVNPAYMQLVGHRDIIGKTVFDALPEVRDQGYIDKLDSVLATGNALRIEGARIILQRYPDGPGEERFVDFVYQPVLDAAGKVTGIFANGVDVTERIVATADLRNSEMFLRSILAASSDCIMVLTLDGHLLYWSNGGDVIMDIAADADIPDTAWIDLWDEPDRTEACKALELARSGINSRFQGFRSTRFESQIYWDVRVSTMGGAAGQPERILVVSRDISHLKRVEDERDLLTNELSHRLKNMFTMVQSVIRQTLRQTTTVEHGRKVLAERVRALEAAQDLLTRSSLDTMAIEEVLSSALAPHQSGEGHFDIFGPPASLNGRQGLGLSLALHELCTNAAKYGALSAPGGRVLIRWDVTEGGHFTFTWQETDGPEVRSPTTTGFGSALINDGVAFYFDGSATLEFLPTGVVFKLIGSIRTPAADMRRTASDRYAELNVEES